MEIFQPRKDLSTISLEIDGLQKYLRKLLADKEVLVEDLKGYANKEYEAFKKVLAKEKIRLALKRMTIDSGEIAQHDQIKGQFLEAELLERNRETIEFDIKIHERKISDVSEKVEKLKNRLKNQVRNA